MIGLKTPSKTEINEVDSAVSEYCIAILMEDEIGLGSEEKYVLIQVLLNFGLAVPVDKTVKEVVRLFGISEAVYKRSRDLLISKGGLEGCQISIKGKGRARKGVILSPIYLEKLGTLASQTKCDGSEVANKSLIPDLLQSDGYWRQSGFDSKLAELASGTAHKNRPGVASTELKLRPPTRILMCVLLAHSDLTGVVCGLGYADLRKLTGMKRDRLVSHLTKLTEVGFLKASFSGLTGGRLFGVTKGEYLINLEWCGFKVKTLPAITSIFIPPSWGAGFSNEANGIYKQAKCIGVIPSSDIEDVPVRGVIPWGNGAIPFIPLFKDVPDLTKYFLDSNELQIEEMLQWKLEQCASELLNKYWQRLHPNDNVVTDTILSEIASDLLPAKYTDLEETVGYLSPIDNAELVRFIYSIAHRIAFYVKSKLTDLNRYLKGTGLNIHDMQHILLPKYVDRDLMSFCLISYPKKVRAKETCVVLLEGHESKFRNKFTFISDVEDIPDAIRDKYKL